MSIINATQFLQNTKTFSGDLETLSQRVDEAYVDIAKSVNARTIGVYPESAIAATGNSYILNGTKFNSKRILILFSAAGSINLPFTYQTIFQASGTFTDGTNWYGVIFGSSTTISGQVSFYVSSTQLVIQADGGAPSIVNGYIILEFA